MNQENFKISLKDGTNLDSKLLIRGKTCIVAVHGIGEHMGRHQYLEQLNDFSLFQFDLRGHGKSTGQRAAISDFSIFLEDLREVFRYLDANYDFSDFILFGHSMGALIVSGFMQSYVEEHIYPKGVFINAPPISFDGLFGLIHKLPVGVFKILSSCPYGLNLKGLVDLSLLSQDESVESEYISDPLNCLKLHTSLLLNMVTYAKIIFARPLNLKCPAICSVGSKDGIVSPSAIEKYCNEIDTKLTHEIIYHAFHEIHNEIEPYKSEYFKLLKSSFESF